VSVRVVARTNGLEDCPPWYLANEFGSLGTLRTMFRTRNSTWRYRVWSVAGSRTCSTSCGL